MDTFFRRRGFWYCFIYLLTCVELAFTLDTILDIESQRKHLLKKKFECIGRKLTDKPLNRSDGYCPRTWDTVMCWPSAEAGTLAVQPCPDYVSLFDTRQNATKLCMPDGTWYMKGNTSWTNFSACPANSVHTVPRSMAKDIRNMQVMYNVGYGLSLASLLAAVVIMLYFKKLHCPRNTIHLNLFVSFILRAAVSFIRENLIVEGVGFASDIYYEGTKVKFREDVSHWGCRFFFSVFSYIIAASYIWIFVEALYLQMLISISVFSEKNRLKWYMVFGWAFPLSFVIPWVIVRATYDNEYCWNTYYDKPGLIWIIYGPISACNLMNFLIFINIVRILFTKLNASPCPETKKFRYRRLAKSTLILIPLFGVYYIVFSVVNFKRVFYRDAEIITLYVEMFFNSFQGFLLSLLFCFFNSEVQAEFKKAWRRHSLARGGSTRTKMSFLSRSRRDGPSTTEHSNGVVKYTDRVRPYEMNSVSPTSGEEHLPFTSISEDIKDTSFNNRATYLDNSVSKTEEVTPCLYNNNHVSNSDQTDKNGIAR